MNNGGLVVLLALIWALVLLPGALRSRRSSPLISVGTFERAMGVLAGRGGLAGSREGRAVYVPQDVARILGDVTRRRNAVVRKRRRVFTRLVAATAALVPIAVIAGGFAWFVLLASAASLGVYVGLLLRWKGQSERADEVVRMLPDAPEAVARIERHEPARAAAGGDSPYAMQMRPDPDEPNWFRSGVRVWDTM